MSRSPHLRRAVVCAIAAASLLAAAPASSPAAARDVTVMTRNLYLGSDVINLAVAPDIPTLASAIKTNLDLVRANDFRIRAKAIANEIRATKPDLVGLQEVAEWRRGAQGVQDNNLNVLNSKTVLFDYKALLLKELKKRGLKYRVAGIRTWIDIEGPHADGYDVRLTQRDAIIVRKGKGAPKILKVRKGGYDNVFGVNVNAGIGRAVQNRGWVAVDARKAGKRFTFATTHAEAYSPDIAEAQVKQFVAEATPNKKRPAIAVGDINSDPGSVGTSDERGTERLPKAYQAMLAGGFVNELPRRITSGYGEDLRTSDPSKLDEWLDHVFTRGKLKVRSSQLVGTKMFQGLWPSDHRGVVAKIRLPK